MGRSRTFKKAKVLKRILSEIPDVHELFFEHWFIRVPDQETINQCYPFRNERGFKYFGFKWWGKNLLYIKAEFNGKYTMLLPRIVVSVQGKNISARFDADGQALLAGVSPGDLLHYSLAREQPAAQAA